MTAHRYSIVMPSARWIVIPSARWILMPIANLKATFFFRGAQSQPLQQQAVTSSLQSCSQTSRCDAPTILAMPMLLFELLPHAKK